MSYEERIRLLEYKSIDLEARSRRNNVLFHGLKEFRRQDCKNTICQFLSDQFDISIDESAISRAHRVGRYNPLKTRPIIAQFQDFNVAERIVKQGHILSNTSFGVSRDYPIEITRARKTLWSQYKQLKEQSPLAKVGIVYPAKLVMNGSVVTDLFPEWDDVI